MALTVACPGWSFLALVLVWLMGLMGSKKQGATLSLLQKDRVSESNSLLCSAFPAHLVAVVRTALEKNDAFHKYNGFRCLGLQLIPPHFCPLCHPHW